MDHSRSFTTDELEPLLASGVVGFAEVDFEYPNHVKIPCLPVHTKHGLVYPLKGRSCCTSYELSLAKRQGAERARGGCFWACNTLLQERVCPPPFSSFR